MSLFGKWPFGQLVGWLLTQPKNLFAKWLLSQNEKVALLFSLDFGFSAHFLSNKQPTTNFTKHIYKKLAYPASLDNQ